MVEIRPPPPIAVEFLKQQEASRLKAYRDSAGVWTIGYGHTGPEVGPGMRISQAMADRLLVDDLQIAAQRLAENASPETVAGLSDAQYACLLSFVFNAGAQPGW